jgi:hypothetical protein
MREEKLTQKEIQNYTLSSSLMELECKREATQKILENEFFMRVVLRKNKLRSTEVIL